MSFTGNILYWAGTTGSDMLGIGDQHGPQVPESEGSEESKFGTLSGNLHQPSGTSAEPYSSMYKVF